MLQAYACLKELGFILCFPGSNLLMQLILWALLEMGCNITYGMLS